MNIVKQLSRLITNYSDPDSFINKWRRRRISTLLKMMHDRYNEKGSVSILDIGGTKNYWNVIPDDLIRKLNVCITLVNIPGEGIESDEEHFKWVAADGCDLAQFENSSFDIVHSNSVVEHVGDWTRMKMFASEVRRLGRSYFVQTPNFWFPVEPHFVTLFYHWLPEQIRAKLIMMFNLGHYQKADSVDDAMQRVQSARLLDRLMLAELFPDSKIEREKILFLTKSIIAIKD